MRQSRLKITLSFLAVTVAELSVATGFSSRAGAFQLLDRTDIFVLQLMRQTEVY